MDDGGVEDKKLNSVNEGEGDSQETFIIISQIFSNKWVIIAVGVVSFIFLFFGAFNFFSDYSASVVAVSSIIITITISLAIFFHQAEGLEKKSEEIVKSTGDNIGKKFDKKSKEIVQTTVDDVEGKMKNLFDIIEKSQYAGVEEIMAPRLENESDANSKILEEVKKTKKLYIFSISALKFFLNYAGAGNGEIFYEALYKKINEAKKPDDLDFEIKALLINPESKAAKFRDIIETFPTGTPNIEEDIGKAEKGIKILNDLIRSQSQRLNLINEKLIEYKLYSIFPQSGFIMTDNSIFLEPYHYAPTKDFINALEKNADNEDNKQKTTNEKCSTSLTPCTGGRIPLIKYNKNSNVYIAMLKHFETIWLYESLNRDLDKFKAIGIVKKNGETRNNKTIEDNLKFKYNADYNPYGWDAKAVGSSNDYKVTYALSGNKKTLTYMVNTQTAKVTSKQSFLF